MKYQVRRVNSYACVRNINFASVSTIYTIYFGTLHTMWYFLLCIFINKSFINQIVWSNIQSFTLKSLQASKLFETWILNFDGIILLILILKMFNLRLFIVAVVGFFSVLNDNYIIYISKIILMLFMFINKENVLTIIIN
jgi:hypothetical protein